MKIRFATGWSLLTIGLILVVWYGVTRFGLVRPLFLPSPGDTFGALGELLWSGRFVHALAISFGRILGATALAATVGTILGVLMGISSIVDRLLSPITQPFRYLPLTALLPLLILWFGIGEMMKIIFLFVGIVFYFIPLVRNAVRTVPQEFLDVAKGFGASTWSTIRHIYWPQALPQIFDGLIVINGIGWTYVVLAEIVNARNGLGYLIHIAGRLQHSAEVFAGLILIALVALTSDHLLQFIRRRYFFW